MFKINFGISKRFIYITAVIMLLFLLILTVSFYIILLKSSNLVKKSFLSNNEYLLTKKIELVSNSFNFNAPDSLQELSYRLKKLCSSDKDFLYVIIYSKTGDENYFRIKSIIPLNMHINLDIETNKIVQENKEKNYIKESLTKTTVEPKIYSNNSIYWQNVYYPVKIKNSYYVAQFLVSTPDTFTGFKEYISSIKNIKLYIIIIAVISTSILFLVILFFNQNFTLLIKNFSLSLRQAAKGNLDINLNPHTDEDLSELAFSFNSLLDEIKELKEKEKIIEELEKKDTLGDIFKYGVNLVKENALEDAKIIFKALIILKPESFGSYFNLGVIHAKKKDFTASLGMFQHALQFNPGNQLTLQYMDKIKRLKASQEN